MSRASVCIRPAGVADVAALVALVRGSDLIAGQFSGRPLLDDSVEHLTERLTAILRESPRTLLVAVDEAGAVAGLLACRIDEVGAIDLTPVLQVTHLIVAPDHRRRGIGRALLAAAVQLADEHGLERVLATAATGSREGNRYLARLGFSPLVTHRIAATSVLRRSLGLDGAPQRTAVLRRARRLRAQRSGVAARVAQ